MGTTAGILCFLVLLIQVVTRADSHECETNCAVEATTLTCSECIPESLEDPSIQHVVLRVSNNTLGSRHCLFCSSTWRNVTSLHLTSNYEPSNAFIGHALFRGLVHLQMLRIQLPWLNGFRGSTFEGVENIRQLIFFNCVRLPLNQITTVLEATHTLKRLSELVLDKVCTLARIQVNDQGQVHAGSLLFTADFFKALSTTRLTIANSAVEYFAFQDMLPICDTLTYFDVSKVIVNKVSYESSRTCGSLKFVNLIDVTDASQYVKIKNGEVLNKYYTFNVSWTDQSIFFANVEKANLSIHQFDSNGHLIFRNLTVKFIMNDRLKLKELSLKNNRLRNMDVIVIIEGHMQLEGIDISSNDMIYIRPEVFQYLNALRRVSLANNMLYKMQCSRDFERLFSNLTNLIEIDLSYNNLSYIPKCMFVHNRNMRIIMVAGNNLKQVTFDAQTFSSLQVLNMSWNNISFFNLTSMAYLQSMRNHYQTSNVAFHVDISNNPFVCSCDTLKFMHELITVDFFIRDTEAYECTWEHKRHPINQHTIETVIYSCDKDERLKRSILTYSLTISISLFVIALFVVVLVKMIRRSRWKRRQRSNTQLLQDHQLRYRLPVFLAFSHLDHDFVMTNVYHTLEHGLQKLLDTQREVISIGERQFRLGEYVFDEMVRCIEMSAVFIAVVSRNFCESTYCVNELRQAQQTGTPVLLIYKEEVDEDRMPPAVHEMFKRYVRVRFRENNDQYYIVPDWDTIYEYIIDLVRD